ncbi:MAG: hypothetical protein LBM13_02010, partial [Candidatus Ancillula sp.]|nr:hypothetical protein [Candidatus Ancillula sp.]
KRLDLIKSGFESIDNCVLISAPGRTEVGGNHTDHQHGNVLAAAVNLDVLGFVEKTDDNIITVNSEGFGETEIILGQNFENLEPYYDEDDTASQIRGVAAALKNWGYNIGGFKAHVTSDVLGGSGLSSSAAFENFIAQSLNELYNDDKIAAPVLARAGQYSENKFMQKPSGLMDQTASAVGGFVQIDFKDPSQAKINPVQFDLDSVGYSLCITDTKGSHAGLTEAYAAMPNEMKEVAKFFDKEVLRDVDEKEFWVNLSRIRESLKRSNVKNVDRAILRAAHYFRDNEIAVAEAEALADNNFDLFLNLINESGRSSILRLQNIYIDPKEENVALALALSEHVLETDGKTCGAWRVHGGGLAGTIQAFVPENKLDEYCSTLNNVFGEGSCMVLKIRKYGAITINL